MLTVIVDDPKRLPLIASVPALTVVVPVYFFLIRPKQSTTGSCNTTSHSPTNNNPGHHNNNLVTWGTDGSVVTKDDGSTFIYNNTLGGYWVFDPANPLNNTARAQATTPALNEPWNYGVDLIRG